MEFGSLGASVCGMWLCSVTGGDGLASGFEVSCVRLSEVERRKL